MTAPEPERRAGKSQAGKTYDFSQRVCEVFVGATTVHCVEMRREDNPGDRRFRDLQRFSVGVFRIDRASMDGRETMVFEGEWIH